MLRPVLRASWPCHKTVVQVSSSFVFDSGCGTVHANEPVDVLARFEALGALAGLSPSAVRSQVSAALDVVVHVARSQGVRHVRAVALLRRSERGVRVEPALAWAGPGSEPQTGTGWPRLAARLGLPVVEPTGQAAEALPGTDDSAGAA